MPTWLEKHGMTYALLRLAEDPRPPWASALGLRACLINGVEMPLPSPRLHFKRRLGSFVAHPRANTDYQVRQEAHYERHLREMKVRRREADASSGSSGAPGRIILLEQSIMAH